MKEDQQDTPRELLISHGWDLHIGIRNAIVEFEEKTGLFIEEIRTIRKGDYELTLGDIHIAFQLPHQTQTEQQRTTFKDPRP